MQTLINAALEFIEGRQAFVQDDPYGDCTEEDKASVCREHALIQSEAAQLADLLAAAREIARMTSPSIEHLLRRQGYSFEADRMAELVAAIEAIHTGTNGSRS